MSGPRSKSEKGGAGQPQSRAATETREQELPYALEQCRWDRQITVGGWCKMKKVSCNLVFKSKEIPPCFYSLIERTFNSSRYYSLLITD